MKVGDCAPMTSCTINTGDVTANFSAPPGQRFVFMLLGVEPKKGPPLEPKLVLEALGWTAITRDTPAEELESIIEDCQKELARRAAEG